MQYFELENYFQCSLRRNYSFAVMLNWDRNNVCREYNAYASDGDSTSKHGIVSRKEQYAQSLAFSIVLGSTQRHTWCGNRVILQMLV